MNESLIPGRGYLLGGGSAIASGWQVLAHSRKGARINERLQKKNYVGNWGSFVLFMFAHAREQFRQIFGVELLSWGWPILRPRIPSLFSTSVSAEMPKPRPYKVAGADISTAIGYVIELIETSALAPLRSVNAGGWWRRPRSPSLETGLKLENPGRFDGRPYVNSSQSITAKKVDAIQRIHAYVPVAASLMAAP
jgi:hypothetical protein